MLIYNRNPEQLELTKEALESVLVQDVGGLDIFLINNGSDEETVAWLKGFENNTDSPHWFYISHHEKNQSPVLLSNKYLETIFATHPYVLSLANDVVIPPNMYSEMLKWPRGFVTASATGEKNFPVFGTSKAVSECTPMSVMLARKWAYDALMAKDGYYLDPKYFLYASDCDMALRMAACGIRGIQIDIQFWHYCSAHWRLMPPEEGSKETAKADADRSTFESKWGFRVDSPRYGESTNDINFRGVIPNFVRQERRV